MTIEDRLIFEKEKGDISELFAKHRRPGMMN